MVSRILSNRSVRLARGVALAALLGAGVSACASTQRAYPLADLGETRGATPPASSHGLVGTDKPYQVAGQWYYPQADPSYDQVGMASWYGYPFQARRTANGEVFDQTLISAAHKTLPLPCIVEVTNLQNGKVLRVRVNDRGPFVDGRLIDLSRAAAEQLGFDKQGLTKVRVRYISVAPPLAAPGLMVAQYRAPQYGASQYPAPPRQAPLTGAALAGNAPPQPSADGFDDIERADAGGRIRPDTSGAYAPNAYASNSGAVRQPVSYNSPPMASPSRSAITSNALPVLPGGNSVIGSTGGGFSVQAGAFATRPAADRAVARLSMAGQASIVPIERNGATLYRVTVGAFADADAAAVTKLKVIASGFTDARIVQTF